MTYIHGGELRGLLPALLRRLRCNDYSVDSLGLMNRLTKEGVLPFIVIYIENISREMYWALAALRESDSALERRVLASVSLGTAPEYVAELRGLATPRFRLQVAIGVEDTLAACEEVIGKSDADSQEFTPAACPRSCTELSERLFALAPASGRGEPEEIALSLTRMDCKESAREALKKRNGDPPSGVLDYAAAWAHLGMQDFEAARHHAIRAYNALGDTVPTRGLLARVYNSLNHREQAIEQYRALLSLAPDDLGAQYMLVLLLHRVGRAVEGLDILRKLTQHPEIAYDGSIGFIYAETLTKLGRTEEARAEWIRLREVDPMYAQCAQEQLEALK